jgi:hypothetical protein
LSIVGESYNKNKHNYNKNAETFIQAAVVTLQFPKINREKKNSILKLPTKE